MAARSWARPTGEDSAARVRLESTDTGGEVRYRIEFPFLVGDRSADELLITGAGTIEDHRIRSESGLPVSDVVVSLPVGFDVERLIVRSRPERIVIHLPSEDLLETCARVLDGDGGAADELIGTFASPVEIPLICGSFLGLDDTLALIQELVRRDRHVQSMLHSYRYAIVRGAVVSRSGLHVGSYRELKELVNGLDAISEIGAVSVVDALADVIETVHDSPDDTEQLLESLGVDLETLHERDDGLFTSCFLAHIACTAGVEVALQYELPRTLPPRGYYERRKRAVFRAGYGDRGTAWRRLLNAARRRSDDEVGYVLAYTLYWTGEESRSDSRLSELLLRGAELAAAHSSLRKIEYKARYERLIAAGHRLRGTHCWGPSIANFAAAGELTTEHRFLSEWEPMLARGLVYSRQLSLNGEHEMAIGALDRTIDDFLAAAPPKPVANRSVRHLKAQKCEIESLLYRSDDPARARRLLEEARDHYEAIGFERSGDRIDRKLHSLPEAPTTKAAGTPQIEEFEGRPQVGEESPVSPEPAPVVDGRVELPATAEANGDWLESLEYPDEEAVRENYDDKFEDPYMV